MMDDPDYDALRRLVMRYGAKRVILTIRHIECHEPEPLRFHALIAILEKRLDATTKH